MSSKDLSTYQKNADNENINASYIDGVLTVNIPKKEPQKDLTKKITIK